MLPLRGTVKWFNPAKGFGFIRPDDGGPDVFLPSSVVSMAAIDELLPSDIVDYEARDDPHGRHAKATRVALYWRVPPKEA